MNESISFIKEEKKDYPCLPIGPHVAELTEVSSGMKQAPWDKEPVFKITFIFEVPQDDGFALKIWRDNKAVKSERSNLMKDFCKMSLTDMTEALKLSDSDVYNKLKSLVGTKFLVSVQHSPKTGKHYFESVTTLPTALQALNKKTPEEEKAEMLEHENARIPVTIDEDDIPF